MKDISQLFWFPVKNSYFWLSDITAYRIGDNDTFEDGTDAGFHFKPRNGLFDTGTTLLYFP